LGAAFGVMIGEAAVSATGTRPRITFITQVPAGSKAIRQARCDSPAPACSAIQIGMWRCRSGIAEASQAKGGRIADGLFYRPDKTLSCQTHREQ
jgi:hypothetical protein